MWAPKKKKKKKQAKRYQMGKKGKLSLDGQISNGFVRAT